MVVGFYGYGVISNIRNVSFSHCFVNNSYYDQIDKSQMIIFMKNRAPYINYYYHYCVRGMRTQPLICVECSVHYWVSCAINKGGFFEIAFSSSSSTHLPRFEALA